MMNEGIVQEYNAELVPASTPAPHVRSIIPPPTMMRHACRCAFHTIRHLVLAEGPDPISFSSTTKQELKYDARFPWSAPPSSRSYCSDCMTESDGGSEP